MITNRKRIYFECGKGWERIINECLDEMEETTYAKIDILQIKEKYGTLRIYFEVTANDQEESLDLLNSVVSKYETLSGHICELCGEFDTAKLRERSSWFKTLCDTCAEKENWRD